MLFSLHTLLSELSSLSINLGFFLSQGSDGRCIALGSRYRFHCLYLLYPDKCSEPIAKDCPDVVVRASKYFQQ